MGTPEIYGYTYLGTKFREVLRVTPSGIVLPRGATISWSDVIGYRAYPDFLFDVVYTLIGSAKPRVCIYFANGKRLCIRGDLLTSAPHHESPDSDQSVLPAFSRLVRHLASNGVQPWTGPKEELVLAGTGWLLFVIGAASAAGLTAIRRWPVSFLEAAVVGGVLLAQGAFGLAPLVSIAARRAFVKAMHRRQGQSV